MDGFCRPPKRPPPVLEAGVVDPNKDVPELAGAEGLSGVATLPKRDFGASLDCFSSGLGPNEKVGGAVEAGAGAPNKPCAGLFSAPVVAGLPKPEKEKPVLPVVPGAEVPELFPKRPPPVFAFLFVAPNKP